MNNFVAVRIKRTVPIIESCKILSSSIQLQKSTVYAPFMSLFHLLSQDCYPVQLFSHMLNQVKPSSKPHLTSLKNRAADERAGCLQNVPIKLKIRPVRRECPGSLICTLAWKALAFVTVVSTKHVLFDGEDHLGHLACSLSLSN